MAAGPSGDNPAERAYIKAVMKTTLLDAEREMVLAKRWREQGDERALHELTQAYIRFVVSIASKFKNYGLPMSDLISEGNVGLMVAASRFEPERGFRFSTYAGWWVRSTIQEYVLRNWSIVRMGSSSAQRSLFFKLRGLRARLGDLGVSIMDSEHRTFIAEELGVREGDVDNMASRLSASDKSLNAPIDLEGPVEWQDLLVDEGADPEKDAIEQADREKLKVWIERALETLNAREVSILRKRYLSDDPETLSNMGSEFGISKQRVRQVEARALKKVRSNLELQAGDLQQLELLS